MIGVKIERKGEMYLLEFATYDNMLDYLRLNRPSQFCFAFDGESTTGSKPVASYKVKPSETVPLGGDSA